MEELCTTPLESRQKVKESRYSLALRDLLGGINKASIWSVLGWQDIKQRYRRSVLGPFWLTISSAIMVAALGILYATLLGQSIQEFIPHVAAGLLVWTFLSTMILEGCTVFIASEGLIKQIRLPLTVHVCRMVWRNVMIFLHNIVILFCVLYFVPEVNIPDLLSIPFSIFLIALNGIWLGIVLGVLCTRFRDIHQIITNFVQILFFLTPIFWKPELLQDRGWVAVYNPAFHFIELVRSPLMGNGIPVFSWGVVTALTVAGFMFAYVLLARYRHRVAYWL
ncbi:ABC transporter permease [Amphritea sp. HPY]|uniref:ABC transporter permease n=1 Tax=Amphritea sp. HPY TaxID=3421652 RepID=UPI003D7EC326